MVRALGLGSAARSRRICTTVAAPAIEQHRLRVAPVVETRRARRIAVSAAGDAATSVKDGAGHAPALAADVREAGIAPHGRIPFSARRISIDAAGPANWIERAAAWPSQRGVAISSARLRCSACTAAQHRPTAPVSLGATRAGKVSARLWRARRIGDAHAGRAAARLRCAARAAVGREAPAAVSLLAACRAHLGTRPSLAGFRGAAVARYPSAAARLGRGARAAIEDRAAPVAGLSAGHSLLRARLSRRARSSALAGLIGIAAADLRCRARRAGNLSAAAVALIAARSGRIVVARQRDAPAATYARDAAAAADLRRLARAAVNGTTAAVALESTVRRWVVRATECHAAIGCADARPAGTGLARAATTAVDRSPATIGSGPAGRSPICARHRSACRARAGARARCLRRREALSVRALRGTTAHVAR